MNDWAVDFLPEGTPAAVTAGKDIQIAKFQAWKYTGTNRFDPAVAAPSRHKERKREGNDAENHEGQCEAVN